MAHHDIEATVSGKDVILAKIPVLDVGDTVKYKLKGNGALAILFPDRSPFGDRDERNTQVTAGQTLKVERDGKFQCGCQVMMAGANTPIGWDPRDPVGTRNSGGDHEVRKPRN
jgi:hypothetical protein